MDEKDKREGPFDEGKKWMEKHREKEKHRKRQRERERVREIQA